MSGWVPSASASSPTFWTNTSASRKLPKRKVFSIRCASSMSAHSGACGRSSSASARVSGGIPPRHGVQVFSTSASAMSSSVNQYDHSGPAPSLPRQAPSSAQRTQASQGVGNQKSLRPCAIGGERACKGRLGKSGEVHGESLEIGERAVVEGAFVSSPQDHAGRAARLQRFAPAGRTQAPPVAGPQAGKAELGHRRRKIIAGGFGKLQKRGSHEGADCVAPEVFWIGVAATVTKEARLGHHRADVEPVAEDIPRRARATSTVPAVVPQHCRLLGLRHAPPGERYASEGTETLGATGQLGRSPAMLDFAIDVSREFVPVLSIQAVDVGAIEIRKKRHSAKAE